MRKVFLLILIFSFCWLEKCFSATLTEIGKVSGVYRRGKGLIVTVELELKLPIGLVVYIDKDRQIPAILGDHHGIEQNKHIYEGTVAKQVEIATGEKVYAVGEKKQGTTEVYLKLDRKALFVPKKEGHVLASYGRQVHIDRGSLHEVRERDIYAIYDSSGKYKGKIELAGIGDHQAIGKLYTDTKKEIGPGDTVKYLGQRRFFGLGVYGSVDMNSVVNVFGSIVDKSEKRVEARSGGLLWWWTFTNGWGINWIWMSHHSSLETEKKYFKMNYWFPLTIRKHFFYPSWISPYIGCSFGWLEVGFGEQFGGAKWYKNIFLSPTTGLELFQTKLFHVSFNANYITAPEMEHSDEKFQYSVWIVSFGITTNW
ncbi:MAG: hypothetical protein ABIJ11_02500 [Elusimicrobiota bacterium]